MKVKGEEIAWPAGTDRVVIGAVARAEVNLVLGSGLGLLGNIIWFLLAGMPYKEDKEADAFFDAMAETGFAYSLSSEDTGRGEKNHKGSSATEWSVIFSAPDIFDIAEDLPNTFLDEDRTAHPIYRRVPFAHAFRTDDGRMDFVIVNVHLYPDGKKAGTKGNNRQLERKAELQAIAAWVDQNDELEKDFLIVGDMNINNATELATVTPRGFRSLNDQCLKTNVAKVVKPYDHVMYRAIAEIDQGFDFQVIDLVEAMRPLWDGEGVYPGDLEKKKGFEYFYSDHHPVIFRFQIPESDDD